MAKPLRVILEAKKEVEGKDTKLKGVKKSTIHTGEPTDEYPGLGPKEKDGQDFVSIHKVEVHADRVGNGDEDYKGKTKPAKYKKQKDSVYEETLEEKYVGFQKLKAKIAAKGGVKNPAAVAAAIGRKKYGKKKFQKAAAEDHKMKGMKPKKSVEEAASCDTPEPHEKSKSKKLLLGGKKQEVQEREMTSGEKAKEKRIKSKVDPSGMKASMIDQYGPEKGKQVYFAKIRKMAMESVIKKTKTKMKETTGPDTPIKMPSGKGGDNANSPGFNV